MKINNIVAKVGDSLTHIPKCINCTVTLVEPNSVDFTVINGAWDGTLDSNFWVNNIMNSTQTYEKDWRIENE